MCLVPISHIFAAPHMYTAATAWIAPSISHTDSKLGYARFGILTSWAARLRCVDTLVVPTLPVVAFVVYDAVGPVLTCFALCNPLSFLPTLLSDPSIAPGYP